MSRSCFSTLPSWWSRSTAPRSRSIGDRIGWLAPILIPSPRISTRTIPSIKVSAGPSTRMANFMGRATRSARRSGALMAMVFGSTSAKITTITVITPVA